MSISELMSVLEEIKNREGDLKVCISESHEYWGEIQTYLTMYNIKVDLSAQPDGPKSGVTEKALVFKY